MRYHHPWEPFPNEQEFERREDVSFREKIYILLHWRCIKIFLKKGDRRWKQNGFL